MPAAAAVGAAPADRGPSRGLRVAMFGVMTFMLIAVISVIVVTLFAVVFLSRKSQDVVIHRMHPERPLGAELPFQLPPRHQVQVEERMVRRRRPFMSRQQQQKKGHGKRRPAAAVAMSARSRANKLVARIHRRLARKPFFKRQKHQKRRKAKAKPSYD